MTASPLEMMVMAREADHAHSDVPSNTIMPIFFLESIGFYLEITNFSLEKGIGNLSDRPRDHSST
jgi:hypothetical protein